MRIEYANTFFNHHVPLYVVSFVAAVPRLGTQSTTSRHSHSDTCTQCVTTSCTTRTARRSLCVASCSDIEYLLLRSLPTPRYSWQALSHSASVQLLVLAVLHVRCRTQSRAMAVLHARCCRFATRCAVHTHSRCATACSLARAIRCRTTHAVVARR